jgi:phosphate starvation-inducible PhoH-like protein
LSEIILQVEGVDPLTLFGEKNKNLNLLRQSVPEVSITSRGSKVKIIGEKKFTQKAKDRLEMMVRLLQEHKELTEHTVRDLLQGENPFQTRLGNTSLNKTLLHGRDGRKIKAKTKNQARLVAAAEHNDVVFAVGPARHR